MSISLTLPNMRYGKYFAMVGTKVQVQLYCIDGIIKNEVDRQ